MSLQGKILITAKSQLGVVETGGADGHSGNIVPYWEWWRSVTKMNMQGASWCGAFVSWVFAQNKSSNLIAALNSHGFIYCPDLEKFAIRNKLVIADKRKAQPGDIVLFDWEGAGRADHVGIVEKNLSATSPYLQTIEGNTSGEGVLGSQRNGGGVYRRNRHLDSTIRMIVRPNYPVKLTSLVSTAG